MVYIWTSNNNVHELTDEFNDYYLELFIQLRVECWFAV